MKPRQTHRLSVAAFLAAAFLGGAASAGDIKGRAGDTGGGALPGAEVTLENVAAGTSTVAITDPAGAYAFTGLKAGMYRLIVHMPGFSEVARNISLATDQSNAELNLVLTVGNVQSEVTVTASRSSRDALVVPLRAESLGEETMAATNPASSGELMIQATGVTPVGSGPFQMRPRLRGLDSTRVLVLVDGERLNNARTATDRAGVEVGLVDAASIESIEVISGAGSVLYGTDALSGTINIRTAQPGFSDKARFIANANGYYSSNENGARGNLGVGVTAPRYALNISGGKESFDNYTSGGEDGAVLEDSRPLYANGTLKQADTIDTNFGFTFKAFPDPFNAPFVRTTTEIPTSNLDGTTLNGNGLFAFNDKQSLKVKYFHREAKDVGFPDFVPPQFFQGIVLPYSKLDKVSARSGLRRAGHLPDLAPQRHHRRPHLTTRTTARTIGRVPPRRTSWDRWCSARAGPPRWSSPLSSPLGRPPSPNQPAFRTRLSATWRPSRRTSGTSPRR